MEEDPDPVDDVDDPVLPAEGFPAEAVDPAGADPVPLPAAVSLAGPDPDEVETGTEGDSQDMDEIRRQLAELQKRISKL